MRFTKGWTVFLLVLLLGCSGLGYGCFVPRVSEAHIRQEIEASLPVGTPAAAVKAWLRAHGATFVSDIATMRDGRVVGVYGKIGDAGPYFTSSDTEIRIEFQLDGEGRMTSYSVHTFVYSL